MYFNVGYNADRCIIFNDMFVDFANGIFLSDNLFYEIFSTVDFVSLIFFLNPIINNYC